MILQILGLASLGHILAEAFQHAGIDRRPFNCNLCLATWISIIPLVIGYGNLGFLLAPLTGVVSEIIYRLLNRL